MAKAKRDDNKLGDRAYEGRFIGYVEGQPGFYRFWIPELRRVIQSRDAVFHEQEAKLPTKPAGQLVEIDTTAIGQWGI